MLDRASVLWQNLAYVKNLSARLPSQQIFRPKAAIVSKNGVFGPYSLAIALRSDGLQHAETVGCTAAPFLAEGAAQICASAPETFHLNNPRMLTGHAQDFSWYGKHSVAEFAPI